MDSAPAEATGDSSTNSNREGDSQEPRSPDESSAGEGNKNDGFFDCNICLDTASDPVVTFCGHLFCWPCIYKWIELHTESPICPVCKAQLTTSKMIPVYGRGRGNEPKAKGESSANVPHRPNGQRTEPERRPSQGAFNPFAGRAHTQFHNVSIFGGVGGYPSLFSRQFYHFPPNGFSSRGTMPHTHHMLRAEGLTGQELENMVLSRYLLMAGVLVIFCLLLF